jgi:hypothetical protein
LKQATFVPKVFLGGTCNGSKWREELIPLLQIDYFNPVVPDWTSAAYEEELKQREECDFCLYVITPEMKGVYSIAEVVDDSNKYPEKTIFCLLEDSINEDQLKTGKLNTKYGCFSYAPGKSLNAVATLVKENGAEVFSTLQEVADYLNCSGKPWAY